MGGGLRPSHPITLDNQTQILRAKSRNLSRSCTIPTFPNGPPSAIPDHPPVIPDPDLGPMYTSPPTTNALSPPTTNPSSPAPIPRHSRPSPNVIPSEVEESKPFMHNPDLPKRPPVRHPRPPTRHPRPRSGTCYYTSVTPDHHREPATHPSSPTPIGNLPRHQKNRYSRATRQRTPTRSLFQNLHSTTSSPFWEWMTRSSTGFVAHIPISYEFRLRPHTNPISPVREETF